MKTSMTGIILAGGKNSRMGVNKAFLEINGIRLIDKVVSVLKELFSEILIVTNDPLSYTEFSSSVIVIDIYKNKGALGGIYSGLFFASNEYSFVTACDMPFLNKDFILYLAQRAEKHDIVVPQSSDGFQPLYAVYSKNCLAPIKRNLEADKLKITGFYKGLRVLTVTEDTINSFNENGNLFLNINTPKELEKIKLNPES
jgi:molybdopterin-guanine dinucleotide biosynthesis protein A